MIKKLLLIFLLIPAVFATTIINAHDLNIVATRYEPFPAEPGSYVDLWVKVQNLGAKKIEDVTFVLEPQYPFSLDPGSNASRYYGTVQGRQEILMKFKLRVDENAVEGENELGLIYKKGDDTLETLDFNITVYTADANIMLHDVQYDQLSPGTEGKIHLTIKNVADSSLKNVALTLGNIDEISIINSSNERYVGKIASKEEKTISFSAIMSPDAELGIYKMPLNISYSDMLWNNFTKTREVAILTNEGPEYILNLEEADVFTVNKLGEVTVSISNTGSSSMKFTTIELLATDNYEIFGKDAEYLGNLDPDDFDTASFRIYAKAEDAKLKLNLSYKDEYNKPYSTISELDLPIYSEEKLNKLCLGNRCNHTTETVIIVIVVLAILYFLYRKFRRKK